MLVYCTAHPHTHQGYRPFHPAPTPAHPFLILVSHPSTHPFLQLTEAPRAPPASAESSAPAASQLEAQATAVRVILADRTFGLAALGLALKESPSEVAAIRNHMAACLGMKL